MYYVRERSFFGKATEVAIKIRKFENHERVSGSICYGYNKSENGLIVDKEESKIIHYIYKRYLELRKRDLSKTKTMRELRKSLKKRNYLMVGILGFRFLTLVKGTA